MSTARLRQEHPKITPRPERASTLMFGRQSIKVKGEGGLRQHGNVAVRVAAVRHHLLDKT